MKSVERRQRSQRTLAAILVALARPLLRINLAQYKRDVRSAIFPADEPDLVIAGVDAERLLFVGDVAVAGYGVLRHGMATPAHVARMVAHGRERGCEWTTVASPDLTVARAARLRELTAEPVDAAIILLGIPDVLLATSVAEWSRNLQTVADRIRSRSGSRCALVFAGIAPLADFRPIPPLARKLLELQIDQLNTATESMASRIPGATFVPFPTWRIGEMYVQQSFSWKSLHEMSAQALAPATVTALEARPVRWTRTSTLRHPFI